MAISSPDEVLHFRNNMSIELNYRNTLTYSRCKAYEAKAMAQGFVWHQIIVQHNSKCRGVDGKREILDALFEVVEDEEFFPVAYRAGAKEDRFLVRQCKPALDKLFERNLRLKLSNGVSVYLQVQLNVGDFKFGQISPSTAISQALVRLYGCMECINGEDGILNLSRFSENQELLDIVVNLGNRSVFERICDVIYRNDEQFRSVNGFVLSHNYIKNVSPLKIFVGVDFAILDFRDNQIRSANRLCRDLQDVKADELLLAGNPITRSATYPECLKTIFKNFKRIDGIPVENLSKTYTPLSYDIDLECDGYRIDWSNKSDIEKFHNSDDWHAVMIPDPEQEFTKEEILDYFFITISPDLTDIYPCYYKFFSGEHQFLVRQCFSQLRYLVENCNLEIKIPRLVAPPSPSAMDAAMYDLSTQVQIGKVLVYYLRMDISTFKPGQVEPLECIDKALSRRYNAMDRLLNLSNFQNTEGLENIIINMSSPTILNRVLMHASRKYLTNCVELLLCHNKIVSGSFSKVLSLMGNLKAIDLGNNWIQDLKDIKDLHVLNLKSLRLDGNPLCAKYAFASEYIKAVRSCFPELNKLDNIEITKKGNLSTQKNFLCDVKGYDFVEQFLTKYFQIYESDDRLSLRDLYHPKALFSMTCSYSPSMVNSQTMKRISKYVNHGRNILKMTNFSRASSSIHFGPNEIMQVFMTLPKVTHDVLTFTTDTTTFDEHMVTITINGVFRDEAPTLMDADILMAFSRTFILIPAQHKLGMLKGASAYQIVNDQLNIFNPTATQMKNAFKYLKSVEKKAKGNSITVADKEALLIMFQEIVQIKAVWCTRCLEDANWDFQSALNTFLELCEKNEIPNTAFI